MREIKFRQWISTRHTPLMFYGIGVIKDGHFAGPPDVNFSINPLMQFTGLLDKHGKEIFEGDILATSNDDPADDYDIWSSAEHGYTSVEWNDKYTCFQGSEWTWEDGSDSVFSLRFVEVIGNIYENPELMKEVSDGR